MTLDDSLRELVVSAVAEATRPLVAEVRELRAIVADTNARWVSRSDAAQALGLSVDTVDRRVADGSLRSQRLGRTVRVLLQPPASDNQVTQLAVEARR